MKSQARLAAELVIDGQWRRTVDRVVTAMLSRPVEVRDSIALYPPTEEDYRVTTDFLIALSTPPTTEIALAVPEKKSRKAKADRRQA